ncbi:MAG: hypothetical protein ACRDV0_10110 [Acidimicrobiales bacterium]
MTTAGADRFTELYARRRLASAEGRWSDYRDAVAEMFDLAWSADNHDAAWPLLIEVLYLDANGPTTSGWDPTNSVFDDHQLNTLLVIAEEKRQGVDFALDRYSSRMSERQHTLGAPLAWAAARGKIKGSLGTE